MTVSHSAQCSIILGKDNDDPYFKTSPLRITTPAHPCRGAGVLDPQW